MKFRLLLFALAAKLRVTALISTEFRKRLRKKNMTLTIRTERVNEARTFQIAEGRIRSAAGRDPSAETELVWNDSGIAVRTMLSKNELDGFSAIGRGWLKILGNFENALLFMDLAG